MIASRTTGWFQPSDMAPGGGEAVDVSAAATVTQPCPTGFDKPYRQSARVRRRRGLTYGGGKLSVDHTASLVAYWDRAEG
jgi:hypothetical protein